MGWLLRADRVGAKEVNELGSLLALPLEETQKGQVVDEKRSRPYG